MEIEATIGRLAAGEDLSAEEMDRAMEAIIEGRCRPQQIALFLTGLAMKGETATEIAAAAGVLRRHMRRIHTERRDVLDTCGTGGDGMQTFNVSTAAALVAAAAGVPVAKHGNRRATSKSGSADVLAALGVNVEADVATAELCLDELGICFCFAPLFHESMKQVATVRQQLAIPTIFNLLGPLANPALAAYQLVGVGDPSRRRLLAEVLEMLGTRHSLVVCGDDGLDEVTLAGPTQVSEVGGACREFVWRPEDFGIPPSGLEGVVVSDPRQSAAMIQDVLGGVQGSPRDLVLINAAAALYTAGRARGPRDGVSQAKEAIDSGAARELLHRLARLTNS